jgi:hypothetical protein
MNIRYSGFLVNIFDGLLRFHHEFPAPSIHNFIPCQNVLQDEELVNHYL